MKPNFPLKETSEYVRKGMVIFSVLNILFTDSVPLKNAQKKTTKTLPVFFN